jgi:hypothetical protein
MPYQDLKAVFGQFDERPLKQPPVFRIAGLSMLPFVNRFCPIQPKPSLSSAFKNLTAGFG